MTEEPVTEKPVTEKPVTEKLATEKPVTEKPKTEKPVPKPSGISPNTGDGFSLLSAALWIGAAGTGLYLSQKLYKKK